MLILDLRMVMWLWLCSREKTTLWRSESMCCRFKCGKWRRLWDLCVVDYVAVFFLLKHLHVRWLNCIVLSEWYGTSYLMLFLLFCSSITVFYIVYISYGTISIVELMGILCFDWYIFHVHNSQMVLYADDFFRTLFCYWVCWTYILLMIVLNYFRLSITNQICLLYNIFSYFFTWILENIFSFL